MINIGYDLLAAAAEKKIHFFKSDKLAYFISSSLAGVYVGFCMITILVMAGFMDNFAGIKILQGISFAAALSLVVFAGSELFTGNVFVTMSGFLWGVTTPRNAIMLCAYCYLGNLAGSIAIASLFWGTGYLHGQVLTAATAAIVGKTAPLGANYWFAGFFVMFWFVWRCGAFTE